MYENFRRYFLELLEDIATADTELVLLIVVLVTGVMVIDAIAGIAKMRRTESGVERGSGTVSIDGSRTLPVRRYVSEMQGLSGVPDALICENGYIIPVERKPLARKIRDRYVAQLLVYMRLVEEFEGKRPPYGYLILGSNARRFRIENTPERQAWLQKMIDEMRGILKGATAIPAPHMSKCKKCVVRESCSHRADLVQQDRPAALAVIP